MFLQKKTLGHIQTCKDWAFLFRGVILMKDGHHLVKENGSLAVVERRIANYLWSS
jgi:hypothetical protein